VQWFLISSSIPKQTLLSICQTSPALHAQVISVLYHTIDLSTHAPPDDNTVSFRDRRRTYERQYMFTHQILLNPGYGQYVRSLKWTLGVEREQIWSMACYDHRYWTPPPSQANRVVWRSSETVGKLFECLTQVVSLDIEWANRIGGIIVVPEREGLFPAVQKVNLVSLVTFLTQNCLGYEIDIRNLGQYPKCICYSLRRKQHAPFNFKTGTLRCHTPRFLRSHTERHFLKQQLNKTKA
jgi:hypothetical protein